MNPARAVEAALYGLLVCLRDSQVRRLALKPWGIGLLVYSLAAAGAVALHDNLVAAFVSAPQGFWSSVGFWLVWAAAALALFAAASLLSVVVVFAITGVFQSAIARLVLSNLDAPRIAEDAGGVKAAAGEVGRTIYVEGTKLIWIVPLALLILIAGFIPPLAPLCFVASAWLLAFESCDVVLDLYRLPLSRRFSFSVRNGFTLTCFGAPFVALSMLPLFGFLVPPLAAAGAARLLSSSSAIAPAAGSD